MSNCLSLKEIAAKLNVSPATVSLVFHNKEGVNADTRSRVRQELIANGYIHASETDASETATDIRLLKYTPIGYPDDSFLDNLIIDGICAQAKKVQYNVVITTCHESEFEKVFHRMCSAQPKGLIVLGTSMPLVYENYFNDLQIPLVLVNTQLPLCNVDTVVFDYQLGVFTLVQYLKSLGHTSIGYLYSSFQTSKSLDGYHAFLEALSRFELPLNKEHILPVNPYYDQVYNNIISVLQSTSGVPTAFIAETDSQAIGLINAVKARGLRVPEDISVVSLGGGPYCKLTEPQITSYSIPGEAIGKYAVNLLYTKLHDPSMVVCRMKVSGELVIKESVKSLL